MRVCSAYIQGTLSLAGEVAQTKSKRIDRYKRLGLPFETKGLDTGRMCEVSTVK